MLFSSDTKVELLRKAPLFADLSKPELEHLAKSTEDLEVEAGRVLCREGEVASEFFVIIEGEAEATKDGKSLSTMGAGEFFGEIGLLRDVPRTATVTAVEDTSLRFLDRTAFLNAVTGHGEARRAAEDIASRRLAV